MRLIETGLTFVAKTGGSDELKAIISAISTLVEEATFVANTEGITFRGMDPSHVALIDILWPNSAFERYECDSDIKFGVRVDEFSKLIKRASKKDSIEISISENNMLLVTIGKNKKYKMRLIETGLTFVAKTGGSDELKAIISAISTLVEEATFVANTEGITFRGMDPSHVALIDILWPNSAFERYECDSDIKFGVRVDEFSKLIKRASKKDSIEISISENNMLLVTIGKNKKYKMRLIESSVTDTPLPKITFDVKIGLTTGTFDKILGDVHVVSDYLTISTTESGAVFSGKGDAGEVTIGMSLGKEEDDADSIKSMDVKADGAGSYSLEYLNPVVKAVGSTAEIITCEYSESKPLRIEFMVANIGRIHFYLAPRVDN
jgi:proliferating cell nuclear antigen